MTELETLVDASKGGNLTRVREMVRANPELLMLRLASGESPLMAALYRGHHAVVDELVRLGADLDVFAAAATGRLDALADAVLRPGVVNSFSYDGWTSLHLAAFFGQVEAARRLIGAGADVRATSRNNLANTPLHAATAGKHTDVALLLLENGAEPHAVDSGGHTPERIASENHLTAVLRAIQAKKP